MNRDCRRKPGFIVHRWNRPPLSCQPCRQKKRRCDRGEPCSNCRQRAVPCHYARDDASRSPQKDFDGYLNSSPATVAPAINGDDALSRIQRLEDAVFQNSGFTLNNDQQLQSDYRASAQGMPLLPTPEHQTAQVNTTPFGVSILPPDHLLDTAALLRQLPPREQAMELTDHYAATMQQTIAIFHMPSTRALVGNAYDAISSGETPRLEDILTLFVVFAGAAHGCTPDMLKKLGTTEHGARAAFEAYTRPAVQIIAHPPLYPTTSCLAAMATLLHLLVSADGIPMSVLLLHSRVIMMVRAIQLHKLDGESAQPGCNMVEREVLRRVWWDTVASDWLGSFSGSPLDGDYVFHPRHMAVKYPGNIDDDDLTPTTEEHELPSSLDTPTGMSAFLQRVKLAHLCRETIDTLPSMLLGQEEPDYKSILTLDAKFHAYIDNLPVFFRMDAQSIHESANICRARPMIGSHRVAINLGIHIRICHLHRPYYLRGRTDPQYARSRAACISSARKVLDLRREMDSYSTKSVGPRPARLWKIAQHVFSAALVLASDAALDPAAVDAEAKREQVLDACRTLEESMKESAALREGVQRNLQTLMKTLRGEPGSNLSIAAAPNEEEGNGPSAEHDLTETGEVDWDTWWSEFLDVVPDLDAQGWDALLRGIDFGVTAEGT